MKIYILVMLLFIIFLIVKNYYDNKKQIKNLDLKKLKYLDNSMNDWLSNIKCQPNEPSNPKEGDMYYNTKDNHMYIYARNKWIDDKNTIHLTEK